MDEKGIEYDISKFQYMSGVKGGPYILGVSPKGQYNTLDLLRKGKGLKIPTSTPTSIITLAAMGATEALKLDAQVITGFTSDAAYLAIQQNEAHFMVRPFDAMTRQQQQGIFKGVVQLGDQRDPLAPDVPTIAESTTLSADQKKLLDVLFPEAKLFIASPDTPKDRVQFWEECITKMLNNPDYQNKMKAQFGTWFGAYPAPEVQKQITYLSGHKDDLKLYTPLIKKYVQ
jgi:tripartite-type tricarboxylate transporter receptor subunit TctC